MTHPPTTYPDPYELTNPKSAGWAERVEDEMEQRRG